MMVMRYDVRQTTDQLVRIWDRGLHWWCGLPDDEGKVRVLTWPDTGKAKAWLSACEQRGLRIDLAADIPSPNLDYYQMRGLACARCRAQLGEGVFIGMWESRVAGDGHMELFSCLSCATAAEREYHAATKRARPTGWCHGCQNWTASGVVKVLATNSGPAMVQVWHGYCLPTEADQSA